MNRLNFTKIHNFEFQQISDPAVTLKCGQGHSKSLERLNSLSPFLVSEKWEPRTARGTNGWPAKRPDTDHYTLTCFCLFCFVSFSI